NDVAFVRRQWVFHLEDELHFFVGGYVELASEIAAAGDQFVFRIYEPHVTFLEAVVSLEVVVERLWPGRKHDGLAALIFRHVLGITHPVPQSLGDERQKRME